MAVFKYPDNEKKGTVTYDSSIVKGIIALSVGEVNGAKVETKGPNDKFENIKLTFNGNVVTVDVSVAISYGFSVHDVAFEIQDSIKHSVENMSSFKVAKVNVNVDNVSFNGEGEI